MKKSLLLLAIALIPATFAACGDSKEDVCDDTQYLSDDGCVALTECKADEIEVSAPVQNEDGTGYVSDRVCSDKNGDCKATEYDKDGTCTALTTCDDDQYESKAPTTTTDRECAALTACGDDQYESKAPTATSDRECTDVTECDEDQWEAAAPTDTSDRECADVTECDEDQWEVTAPTETSDRECQDLTECESGETARNNPPTDGSATEDRVCCLASDSIEIVDNEGWPDLTTEDGAYECLVIMGDLNVSGGLVRVPDELIRVAGNVTAENYTAGEFRMNNLEEITQDLTIDGLSNLTSLKGFEKLTVVGGSVNIENNNQLESLNGLNALAAIGGELNIVSNPQLNTLADLNSEVNGALQSVGDGLTITKNNSLCNAEANALADTVDDGTIIRTVGQNTGTCD